MSGEKKQINSMSEKFKNGGSADPDSADPGSAAPERAAPERAAPDSVAPERAHPAEVSAEPGSRSGEAAAQPEAPLHHAVEPLPVALPPKEYEELLKKANEREAYLDELLRAKADFENFRKRMVRERASWESQATRRVLMDLLPILDNFERALAENQATTVESLQAGIRMIYQMQQKLLEKYHVEEIAALHQSFDPELHEAIQQVETDEAEKDGRVVKVLQKGYAHEKSLLRPARVQVGKLTAKAAK